jgi:serine/threonine protein kinase
MELVSGETLRSVLAEKGQLPIDEALGIAREIARGLSKAHEKGIAHRDLKPDNVMVGELVKVLDFGLARIDDATTLDVASTATNEIAGTPGYMSPEQTTGAAVDVRTDVFAFGVVLYEMLAGERPFRGDSGMAVAIAIARDPHEPLSDRRPDVPADLERIVDRCLEKSPAARYANAKEILAQLESISTTPMPASARVSRSAVDAPPARSKLPTFAGVVGLVAILFGAWRWTARSPEGPPLPPTSVSAEPSVVVPLPSAAAPSTASASASSTASASASVVASSIAPKASVALATARPPVTAPSASASAKPRKRNPLDDQE